MSGRALTRNLVVELLLSGVVLVLDQWTKDWASGALATRAHPLPVRVGEPTPLVDAVAGRFGFSGPEAREIVDAESVLLLPAKPLKDPSALAYPAGAPDKHREVYIFVDGLERAPRRVHLLDRYLLNRWLRLLGSSTTAAETRVKIDEVNATRTMVEVVDEAVLHADRAEVDAAFASGRVYPARGARVGSVETTLQPGAVALVTRRIVEVLPSHLRFVYAENPGAAWSFMATASPAVRFWFFTVVSSAAIVLLLVLSVMQPDGRWGPLLAYTSVLGGAVGNLVDRVRTNFVVDFIDMYWGSSHWPTYNVADIGIAVGIALLLIDHFVHSRADAMQAKAGTASGA